jgi:hypothetical protein
VALNSLPRPTPIALTRRYLLEYRCSRRAAMRRTGLVDALAEYRCDHRLPRTTTRPVRPRPLGRTRPSSCSQPLRPDFASTWRAFLLWIDMGSAEPQLKFIVLPATLCLACKETRQVLTAAPAGEFRRSRCLICSLVTACADAGCLDIAARRFGSSRNRERVSGAAHQRVRWLMMSVPRIR